MIRVEDRLDAMRDDDDCSAARMTVARLARSSRSSSRSTALVALSRNSSSGRLTSARASPTRCRWPPDRFRPCSPIQLSTPSGSDATKASMPASRAACSISGSIGVESSEADVLDYRVVDQLRILAGDGDSRQPAPALDVMERPAVHDNRSPDGS